MKPQPKPVEDIRAEIGYIVAQISTPIKQISREAAINQLQALLTSQKNQLIADIRAKLEAKIDYDKLPQGLDPICANIAFKEVNNILSEMEG